MKIISTMGLMGLLLSPLKQSAPIPTMLSWSNQNWQIDNSVRRREPGPNYFSAKNAVVKSDGLHLSITKVSNKWQSAEIYTDTTYGYGKYTFDIESPLNLDKNVVLGLFTWNDNPAYANREIDIEVAKWGYPKDPTNAQFVVQPYNNANLKRIAITGPITVSFNWQPTFVDFTAGAQTWHYTGKVPPPPASVHLNLWLNGGKAPGTAVDLVIKSFTYTK